MPRNHMYELAIETGASLPTIYKWRKGIRVKPMTDYALRAACKKLKIPLPLELSDVAEPAGSEPVDVLAGTGG